MSKGDDRTIAQFSKDFADATMQLLDTTKSFSYFLETNSCKIT